MRDHAPDRSRLSLNQITVERLSLDGAIDACTRHGIQNLGVWRHKLPISDPPEAAGKIRDAGLRVSSLCRGGMFPAATQSERQTRIDDNRRALDEAALLQTPVLVLVCGPAPDRDLTSARAMVADGIAAIVDDANARGVRLGIEPLHPMFAADRSVITTLPEALRLACLFDPELVGVVIDAFHVWWDPDLAANIAEASGRILGFHVSDWPVPLPGILLGRAMMGDGVIEIRRIRRMIDQAGYTGPIEVEIFNQEIWDTDPDQVIATVCERFLSEV